VLRNRFWLGRSFDFSRRRRFRNSLGLRDDLRHGLRCFFRNRFWLGRSFDFGSRGRFRNRFWLGRSFHLSRRRRLRNSLGLRGDLRHGLRCFFRNRFWLGRSFDFGSRGRFRHSLGLLGSFRHSHRLFLTRDDCCFGLCRSFPHLRTQPLCDQDAGLVHFYVFGLDLGYVLMHEDLSHLPALGLR
jgi:hypothetical protein